MIAKTLLLLAGLLSACVAPMSHTPDSVFYSIHAGSVLTLHRPLGIPPEQVSVYFQHGELRNEALLDRYLPHCKFEIRTMAQTPRRVQPGRFIISRVVDETEATTALSGVYWASLQLAGGPPSVYNYVTQLYLTSAQQSDVLRLSCMHWEDVLDDNYLTVPQMREALGDWFSLTLKPAM